MAARRLLPLLILALAISVFLWLRATRPVLEPVEPQERAWPVAVQTVEVTARAPQLELYAVVEAPRLSQLAAVVAAEVAQVAVREGEVVRQGQVLLQLDQRELLLEQRQREADLADVEARIEMRRIRTAQQTRIVATERELLTLIEREVGRARRLQRDDLGSASLLDETRQAFQRQQLALARSETDVAQAPAELAQLQAQRERIRAQLERIHLDLERSTLRAPYDGVIARVAAAPANRVRVGDVLVSMYAPQALQVRAQIPQDDLAAVRDALTQQSLSAQATLDGRALSLRLQRLAGEARSSGQDALFELSGSADWLRSGRVLALRLELPPQPALIELPREALYGNNRVYQLDPETQRMRSMTVQPVGERLYASGDVHLLLHVPNLESGAQLITTQLPNAMDGLRVRPLEAHGS